MNQSLLIAASDVEEIRARGMLEVDVALFDLISGGLADAVKCESNDYSLTISGDNYPVPKIDCNKA